MRSFTPAHPRDIYNNGFVLSDPIKRGVKRGESLPSSECLPVSVQVPLHVSLAVVECLSLSGPGLVLNAPFCVTLGFHALCTSVLRASPVRRMPRVHALWLTTWHAPKRRGGGWGGGGGLTVSMRLLTRTDWGQSTSGGGFLL